MKPRPWSFSSLDSFTTCPRKYHEESILKTVPYVETEAQRLGTQMHKHFEDRLGGSRMPLPAFMAEYEGKMQELEADAEGGQLLTERKVGLNRKLQPTGFFADDVWWRGVIDVQIRRPDGTHRIVDYKTGKVKPKHRQLHLFALYGFAEGAAQVDSEFYWTQTKERTPMVLPASHGPTLWSGMVPDLNDFATAFKLNIWNPKPNGLCKSYCGVVGCEHYGKHPGARR